jgi:hypothetical protein
MRDQVITALLVTLTSGLLACDGEKNESQAPTGPAFKGRPWYEADPEAIFEYPVDDAAYNIRSDGWLNFLSEDGQSIQYVNGVCGVSAKIFSPLDGDGSGDAIMDPGPDRLGPKDRKDPACGGEPRTITIVYDLPLSGEVAADPAETHGTFQNMNQLWQAPEGLSETQAGFNSPRCNILRFKPDTYPGSDSVLVDRNGDVWSLFTKSDDILPDGTVEHHDKAWCDTEQRLYHMPFTVTVRLKP